MSDDNDRLGAAMSLRLPGELNEALEGISAQSGLHKAVLLRLAAERLVEEVKKTGRVPVPQVTL